MRSILLLLVFIILPVCAAAQDPIGDAIDCTDIRINYIDDPNLTKEERLILMEKALMESINKFDYCQKQKALKSAAEISSTDGGGTGLQGSEGDGNMEQETAGKADDAGGAFSDGMESAASSSMSGTEPAPSETGIPEETAADALAEKSVGTQKDFSDKNVRSGVAAKHGNDVKSNSGAAGNNGKTPEDIPDTENDDALAAQIRYAAENEKNPEKRKQLWNEYRKYKGLPTK